MADRAGGDPAPPADLAPHPAGTAPERRTGRRWLRRVGLGLVLVLAAVAIGFQVYQSFMKIGADGVMPMPKPSERVVGGHAVLVVGYDDGKKAVLVRNSWGTKWGDQGYFWMPYAFIADENNADDFWTAD